MTHWDQFVPVFLAVLALAGGAALLACAFRRRLRTLEAERAHLRADLRAARNENRVMEMIALNASDGVVLQDIYARIEWSNPAYSRITGYSAEEVRGRNPLEFMIPPESRMSPEEIKAYKYDIESGILDKFEIVENVRKNGERYWNQLSFAVVDGEDGADPKIIVIARDVTEQIENEAALRRAKEDLQKRAETDVLTDLPNRLKLDAFLRDALEKAETEDGEVGIVHVDLDQFKEVNDALGHAAGDAVLVHTSKVLRTQIRDQDLACRFGGDEFVIICPGVRDPEGLVALSKRILAWLKQPLAWEGVQVTVGASIGIALSNPENRDAQALIRQADIALYEIKNSGRNNVLMYSKELGEAVAKRTEISSALSYGMANNELGVVLQPQFDLARRRVVGFEALMRWHHPRRGLLTPADFFAVAERNGLIEGIDQIAVVSALNALCTLRDAGHADLRMSINVSGRRLNQDNYLDQLKWEVEKRGLKPEDVAIEVLETTLIEGRDNQAARAIAALSAAGFGVELDDFGSGYSGLVNLARLSIQGVKLDRALIQNLVTDRTSQTVVQAIFRLCRDLGLGVVSEGVERPEQASAVAAFGGNIVQGFGIARPMSPERALNWLATTDMETVLSPEPGRQSARRLA